MKKQDFILIAALLGIACLCFTGYFLFFRETGSYAEVTIDGKIYQTLPLNQNATLEIPSGDDQINRLEIKDGSANMTDANCPDHLCVHQKKIMHRGETLVCLPHKVVVTIRSDQDRSNDSPDSISY